MVMFLYNDAVHDSRVWREVRSLSGAGFDVTVIGLQTGGLPEYEQREHGRLRRVAGRGDVQPGASSPFRDGRGPGARLRWLWGYWKHLATWRDAAVAAALEVTDGRPAIWHGHDLTGLLPASRSKRRQGGRLVYDSHELYIESGSVSRLPSPAKWLVRKLEDRIARRADAVVTVNQSIAAELSQRFRQDVTVVMNCSDLGAEAGDRLDSPLRATLGLGARPVVLYHGGVDNGRGIRTTVDALAFLDPRVAFAVVGDGELIGSLATMARRPNLRDRLFLHPAVPMEELPSWIAGADLGIIAFEPTVRNNQLGTPNKLFECLAAGVPVVVSDFPEMRRIVRDIDAGTTCNPQDPQSVARAIRDLLGEPAEEREARRRRCRSAVVSRYNWGMEFEKLGLVYDRLAAAP